jgi:hypothetical protein
MTKVIDYSGMGEEVKKELKPIEFTHYLDEDLGWSQTLAKPIEYDVIKWLGRIDSYDMFCCFRKNKDYSMFYKGHYNDGVV